MGWGGGEQELLSNCNSSWHQPIVCLGVNAKTGVEGGGAGACSRSCSPRADFLLASAHSVSGVGWGDSGGRGLAPA